MTLTREPLDGPVAAPLLRDLVAELQVRYEDDGAAGKPLDPGAFVPPRGAFLVVHADGAPAGCAGLRTLAPGTGEVKRMYVAPWARGRGLGRALLAELDGAARELGLSRLLLETGDAQPEAVALYASAGWERVTPYGEWKDSPRSICFGRDVRSGEVASRDVRSGG